MIESPQSIVNINEIAASTKRLKAMLFGAADYTKETRGKITKERLELLYPLNKMVIAARVSGIDAIDSPYFDIKDAEGLVYHTNIVRNMGYDGKSVIHPSQVKPVNDIFTPTKEEVEFAKKVIEAFKQADEQGIGATVVDGQLVERLHAESAKRTLMIARRAGIL
jgi:citrate lyase subunit beta/citryl-CoA lyase